jgi:hypothetical protein
MFSAQIELLDALVDADTAACIADRYGRWRIPSRHVDCVSSCTSSPS